MHRNRIITTTTNNIDEKTNKSNISSLDQHVYHGAVPLSRAGGALCSPLSFLSTLSDLVLGPGCSSAETELVARAWAAIGAVDAVMDREGAWNWKIS